MLILVMRWEKDSKRCFFVVTVPVFRFRGAEDLEILNDLSPLDLGALDVLPGCEDIMSLYFRQGLKTWILCFDFEMLLAATTPVI